MASLTIDPKTSALVLIDLQQGIVGRQLAPRSGAEVVLNASRLAGSFRELGSTVVLVRVAFLPDLKDVLNAPADAPQQFNPGALPPSWWELVPELGPHAGDLVITKRQWGAI